MTAIELAAEIARPSEGFYPFPYLCPAKVPTIGYGTTRYPNGKKVDLEDPPINKELAEAYLIHDLRKSEESVLRQCPILAVHEKKLAAIIDFVYNLGAGRLQASTLRRRINQEDWPSAKKELMRWVRGGGRVLRGLVIRREIEARLFD